MDPGDKRVDIMASPASVRLVIASRWQRFMAPQPRSPLRQRGGQSLGPFLTSAQVCTRPSIGGYGIDMSTPQTPLKNKAITPIVGITVVIEQVRTADRVRRSIFSGSSYLWWV
jgi:hypothetical protein